MIGFIGGTGPEGRGLALRFVLAGEKAMIGSRDPVRAQDAAQKVLEAAPGAEISGGANAEVAAKSDIVFVSVPYDAQKPTLEDLREQLKGKLVVVVVAPLVFVKGRASAVRVEKGSAALQAKSLLPDSKVVAAFQNISAQTLLDPEKSVDCDVIVCADDADSRRVVMDLAELIKGVRAVDGGGLENARYVEDFTALLLNINRRYKAHSMVKITGI